LFCFVFSVLCEIIPLSIFCKAGLVYINCFSLSLF
jgi:hypothetical protein